MKDIEVRVEEAKQESFKAVYHATSLALDQKSKDNTKWLQDEEVKQSTADAELVNVSCAHSMHFDFVFMSSV